MRECRRVTVRHMSCVEHQHFVLFKSLNSFNQTKFYVTQFIFNQIKSNFKSNFSFIRLIFTTICHNRPIGRFIVVASSVLLILFYIDLYLFVTIMFCVSAASSTGQVLLRPFFMWLCGQRSRQELIELPWIGSVSTLDGLCTGNARPPHLLPSRITTPIIALPSYLRPHLCPRPPAEGTGVFLSVTWFLVRETADWAFVLQDLFGMCLCVLFLSVIRFSNMKVAALLLSMAFLYDIFFVFISPYFFSESVMVKVATGNQPTADPDYCEKYPTDSDCQSTELPMLLLLPRIDDYTGGYTMLGLGDIVLPGLLVAFAARYDVSIGARIPWNFLLMVAGYSVGLMMANVAVYVMEMGQPALLYLVPCTLGILTLKARREGTLHDLWNGPPSLVNGGFYHHNAVPMRRKDLESNGVHIEGEGSPLLYQSQQPTSYQQKPGAVPAMAQHDI
mmetsp:Transcript_73466/g.209005  ORF Transcript_73466/g.209005 Transcript_73466/m.209005 type:complete len:446 (-) Transcript_73466:211-1548(-)